MRAPKYRVGKAVGRLTLVEQQGKNWLCQCSCGKEPVFAEADLPSVRSCGCLVIMGIDPATTTGWAVRFSWRDASAIETGVFYVGKNTSGDKLEWEEKYAVAANYTLKLIDQYKPDFIAIEEQERHFRKYGKKRDEKKGIDRSAVASFLQKLTAVMYKHGLDSPQAVAIMQAVGGGTSNSNQMQLQGIVGAIIGACMTRTVPYGTITSRTWHSIWYRDGTKPGPGQDWKDLAIKTCELEQIPLPPTKAEQRDAAEAVGISACWFKCDLPNFKWVHDRVTKMKTYAAHMLAVKKSPVPSKKDAERADLFEGAAA